MRRRFKKVYVEISSACNLKCAFCPPTRRPAAFLSPEQFGRVLDQVAGSTDSLYFHVKGEPLLHPELGVLLAMAGRAGLKVHLVTNGTLIDRAASTLLGNSAVHQVSFSLHAYQPEMGTPEQYLEPILRFARQARSNGPVVALRFWRYPEPSLLAAVEAEFGWSAPDETLRLGRGFRLAEATYVHFEQEFVWPSLEAPVRGEAGFCLGLRDQLAVLVDGTVVPCCLDGEGVVALGNLFTQALTDIVASKRATALYRGFTERRCVEPLCQRCGFRESLSGKRLDHSPDRAEP